MPAVTCSRLLSKPNRNEGIGKSDDAKTVLSASADDRAHEVVNEEYEISDCPPGLWCKRKREFGWDSAEKIQGCPPGLWCRKRRNRVQNDPETTSPQKTRCPYGFWCVKKRAVGFHNHETIPSCPPTLWCRTIGSTKADTTRQEEDFSSDEKDEKDVADSSRENQRDRVELEQDCPPGLWCKRGLVGK